MLNDLAKNQTVDFWKIFKKGKPQNNSFKASTQSHFFVFFVNLFVFSRLWALKQYVSTVLQGKGIWKVTLNIL